MSKLTRKERRQRRARLEREVIESAPEPEQPEPEQTEGDAMSHDDVDPVDLSDMIETLGDGDVLVRLSCGSDTRLQVIHGSIAGSAEEAAVTYVATLGRFPDDIVSCYCYTNVAEYGPFPIELSLVATARHLRGDDEE